jgi:hypothetical protein
MSRPFASRSLPLLRDKGREGAASPVHDRDRARVDGDDSGIDPNEDLAILSDLIAKIPGLIELSRNSSTN